MSAPAIVPARREPELAGQTVVLIGGSAGIGLETARRARTEGAEVILTGRDPGRLSQAAQQVGAQRTAAFDATDAAALQRFFQDLPAPIDHVLVTVGRPSYGPLLEMDSAQVRDALSDHIVTGLEVARNAAHKMRPGGTLLLMGGTGGRRIGHGLGIVSAATAALPPFTAALALELAPVRVNLIAAGFVDTPLSAALLEDKLEERREELRATLPIHRVVTPADVAALAVHIMTNTALTGATYDIDGGQQFVLPEAPDFARKTERAAPGRRVRAGAAGFLRHPGPPGEPAVPAAAPHQGPAAARRHRNQPRHHDRTAAIEVPNIRRRCGTSRRSSSR